MAGLAKIGKAVGEFSHTSGGGDSSVVLSFSDEDLGMPGGDLVPSVAFNRDAAYFVEVLVLSVGTNSSSTGAAKLNVGLAIKDSTNPYIFPSVASQEASTEYFASNFPGIIRVLTNSGQWDGTDGTFPTGTGYIAGQINVIVKVASIKNTSKLKVFATVYAFGDDSL